MSLDLQEQEQIDELKHFWNQYGNLITWVLIAGLAVYAAYTGWQYWQRTETTKAAVVFDELDKAVAAKDAVKVERVWNDLKDKFGSSAYGQMGGLSAAKALYDASKPKEAEAALKWVADNGKDDEYKAMAKLRLSGLVLERKAYDEALALLATPASASFEPLYADRRGDVWLAQGKRSEARAAFQKALDGLDKKINYREVVELKLNSLGGTADTAASNAASKPATAASGS
jgi:predicted negative regulator of RcsB-dependent stress response